MIRTVTPVALAALLLSGCAYRNVGPAEQASEGAMRDAQRLLDQGRRPLAPEQVGAVRVVDQVYTSGSARMAENGAPLPRQWERGDGFVLRRATLMRLFEIGTAITEVTRIPVSFAPDVTGSGGAAPAAAPAAGPMGGPAGVAPDINAMLSGMGLGPAGGPAFGPIAAGNTAGAQGGVIRPLVGTRDAMKVEFQGRLSQFLNQVASHFGVAWEYRGGEIQIFRNVTRTYTVHALPSNISLNSSLSAESSTSGGGGDSAGATGGSNQRVQSDVSVKIWDEVKAGVQGIVGSYGQVTASLSTGTITVTAPPQIASRVQSYLESQNERLGRQVSVSVQVLQVELSDTDNYSLDLQGVFNQAGQFGFGFGNAASIARAAVTVAQVMEPGAVAAATGALTGSPVMTTGVPGVGMGVFNPQSRLNGTNALIQALSTKGRVSTRQTASVVTLNGVPAPLQIANTRGYVRQVSVTSGATGGGTVQTQLETGTVTTGFNLSLLPRIDPDGQGLLMQFGVNLSELVGSQNGFETFSSNGSTVQLPNVNSRNFVQQAEVPNGATLVLTGFEQVNETARREGTGLPEFMGLGGKQNASRGRTAVVILMTPTVVSRRVISAQ